MRTYEGIWVDIDTGAPTIRDIAVMQGRMCRFNGACQIYWPVLLHSLAVSQLVREDLKIDALLHDAAEVITSDIPRTVKTKENKKIEEKILKRIYTSLDYRWPNKEEWDEVMKADNRILGAECRLFGPRGIISDPHPEWTWVLEPDNEADEVVAYYKNNFNYEDVLHSSGQWVVGYQAMLCGLLKQYKSKKYSVQKELVIVGR